jgi:HlyD family secretion protein
MTVERHWAIAAALFVAGGLAVAVTVGRIHPAPSETGTLAVVPGDFLVAVHAQGELVPQHQNTMVSPFQGKVEKLLDEGQDATKGAEVARMDTHDLEDKLREAQLDLGSAQADLAQQQQNYRSDRLTNAAAVRAAEKDLQLKRLELAITLRGADAKQLRDLQLGVQVATKVYQNAAESLKRKESLVSRGILKASDLSDARLDFLVKRKDMLVARAKYALLKAGSLPETKAIRRLQVKQGEAALAIATHKLRSFERVQALERRKIQLQIDLRHAQIAKLQGQMADAHIRSPLDGTVVYPKFWRNGNLAKISEGDTVWRGQAFLRVADFRKVDVSAEIDEGDIGRVKVGLPVQLTLSTARGKVFHGRVKEISALAADSKNQNQREGAPKVFTATIQVDESASAFRPGLTVDVDFITGQYHHVLSVPSSSVGKDGTRPYVVMADGRRRPVVLSDRNDDRVIVQSGLSAGERIRVDRS